MKSNIIGYWFQSEILITNVNVFKYFTNEFFQTLIFLIVRIGLSVEEMIFKTSTVAGCLTNPTDSKLYLHWDEMKWNINGAVKEENIPVNELCSDLDNITAVMFPGKRQCVQYNIQCFHFRPISHCPRVLAHM